MENVWLGISAGILATSLMTLFLWLLTFSGLTNADMVRAVGSIVTRTYRRSLGPGLAIHFVVGVIMAFIYLTVLSYLVPSSVITFVLIGATFGLFHGLIVSVILVILVAEYHPLQRFRRAGFGVALAHVAAHVIYGLVIGLMVGYFGLNVSAGSGLTH